MGMAADFRNNEAIAFLLNLSILQRDREALMRSYTAYITGYGERGELATQVTLALRLSFSHGPACGRFSL